VPLALQLTASVARHQNARAHHGRIVLVLDGRIVLVLGCNQPCAIAAHGRISLRHRGREIGLRGVRVSLAAHHAQRVVVTISRGTLVATLSALHRRHRVTVTINVDAGASGGARGHYLVHIGLRG